MIITRETDIPNVIPRVSTILELLSSPELFLTLHDKVLSDLTANDAESDIPVMKLFVILLSLLINDEKSF